jgi:DNA-binding transcriptional LysR family regulator
MDLDQLSTFAQIVESGSLTAAARARRRSLPSVSRQLRALEEDLGVTLIRRTTRRLAITPEGRDLYEHAARILREVQAARDGARAGKLRGSLTVSVPVTLGQWLVVPRLGAFLREHPALTLEVRLEDRFSDLVAEGVDLVVRAGGLVPDSTALIATPLASFTRILVASRAYLTAHGTPRDPQALARHDCLVQANAGSSLDRWRLCHGDVDRTVEARSRFSASAPLVLREAAISGAGIAFLPEWLVSDDLAAGRLRRVLGDWRSAEITAQAIYSSSLRASTAVRAFIEAMRQPGAFAARSRSRA